MQGSPAANILVGKASHAWRGNAGEKHNTIVLQVRFNEPTLSRMITPPHAQLVKEEEIMSIDIGNAGSAFVEVLAGSSAWPPSQAFEARRCRA